MSFEFVNIHICWRHFWKSMYHEIAVCYGHRCCLFLLFVLIWSWMVWLVGLWCLTPLATIFQLYRGYHFYWWRKPEYPEKTTDKLYDIIILEIFRHWNSVFILFQVKFKIVSDQISRWISHIIYYCRCRTFEF